MPGEQGAFILVSTSSVALAAGQQLDGPTAAACSVLQVHVATARSVRTDAVGTRRLVGYCQHIHTTSCAVLRVLTAASVVAPMLHLPPHCVSHQVQTVSRPDGWR
jgi:hypothetical protein